MKLFFLLFFCLLSLAGFSQGAVQAAVLRVADKVFSWGMANRLDSLATILDARMIAIGADGSIRTKEQCLERPGGVNPAHYKIEVEDRKVVVAESTAVVTGKARFYAASGKVESARHFTFTEVFAAVDPGRTWKLLAITTNGF